MRNDKVICSTEKERIKGSILADAYKDKDSVTTAQAQFARNLANPWVDSSTLVMSAIFAPMQDAIFQAEKARVILDKLKSETETEIVEGLDPDALAEDFMNSRHADATIKMKQAIIEGCKAAQYKNLEDIIHKGTLSYSANAALALMLGQSPENWHQLVADLINRIIDEGVSVTEQYGVMDLDGDSVTNEGVLGWKPGRPSR